jgi:hypothetical protein
MWVDEVKGMEFQSVETNKLIYVKREIDFVGNEIHEFHIKYEHTENSEKLFVMSEMNELNKPYYREFNIIHSDNSCMVYEASREEPLFVYTFNADGEVIKYQDYLGNWFDANYITTFHFQRHTDILKDYCYFDNMLKNDYLENNMSFMDVRIKYLQVMDIN